jgi:hypothetical protein
MKKHASSSLCYLLTSKLPSSGVRNGYNKPTSIKSPHPVTGGQSGYCWLVGGLARQGQQQNK